HSATGKRVSIFAKISTVRIHLIPPRSARAFSSDRSAVSFHSLRRSHLSDHGGGRGHSTGNLTVYIPQNARRGCQDDQGGVKGPSRLKKNSKCCRSSRTTSDRKDSSYLTSSFIIS